MNRPLPPSENHKTILEVEIPFKLTQADLVLEPEALGMTDSESVTRDLRWLYLQYMEGFASDDMVERVMRGAAVLQTRHPNEPFSRCLHTAIVWEFG